MNKTVISILVAVGLIGAGAFVYMQTQTSKTSQMTETASSDKGSSQEKGLFGTKKTESSKTLPVKKDDYKFELESFLPANPLLYVRMTNVKENWDKFEVTPIWQTLKEIDFDKFRANPKGEDSKAPENSFQAKLKEMMLEKFLGQEFAFAFYGDNINVKEFAVENPNDVVGLLNKLLSNFFFVTHLAPEAKAIEVVTKWLDKGTLARFTTNTVDYKGETITVMTTDNPNESFAYVRFDDKLVVTLTQEAAQRSVDIYKKEEVALTEDKGLLKGHKSGLPGHSVMTFFSTMNFVNQFKGQLDDFIAVSQERGANTEQIEQIKAQFDRTMSNMQGFESFVLTADWDKVSQIKFDIHYDADELTPMLAKYYKSCVGKNDSLKFVPERILAYQWGACMGLDYYWQQLQEELAIYPEADAQQVRQRIAEFEQGAGLSIENDIIPAFGSQFGAYLDQIQLGGFFPIPKFVLFLEVGDKSKMDSLLSKLSANPAMVLQEKNYQNINIKYIVLPIGDALQPSYAYVDKYLFIATHHRLIQDALDAWKGEKYALTETDSFKAVDFSLQDNSSGIQFMQVDEFIDVLKDIVEWANNMTMSTMQQQQAFRGGSEQRLTEAKEEVSSLQSEVNEKTLQLDSLKSEIEALTVGSPESIAKQSEFDQLQDELYELEGALDDAILEEEELAAIVEDFNKPGLDPQKRTQAMKEIVFPILESLKSIESVSGKSIIKDSVIETRTYIKTK
jgi:hypothetical protein